MNCKELEELSSNYIEGTLNQAAKEEVEAHLEVCIRCRDRLQRMRALMGRLNDLEMVEPSSGFEARLWSQLRRKSPKGGYRRVLSPAPALAVILIFVAAGYLFLSHSPGQRSYRISEADIVNIQPAGSQILGRGAGFGYQTKGVGVSLERFKPPGDSLSERGTRYILPVITNRPQGESTSF